MAMSAPLGTTTLGLAATTVRWRIFVIVFVLVVLNMLDRTALSIAMPTIAHEFDLQPGMQGVVLSAFFWTYAVLQIPGGWLIDRFGPRRLITVATIAWGLFQSLAVVATGSVVLLLTRLGLGAAEAPLFPAGAKLSAAWLPPRERGRGAVLMDAGSPLGAAIGGVTIAWLMVVFGSWRLAFLAAGIATIVVGVLAWWYLRDDPAGHAGANAVERAHIAATAEGRLAEAAPGRIAAASMAGLLVGRMSWAMINFGLLTWGPSYLAQARGFDLKQMGSATFAVFVAGTAGSLFAGFAADRLFTRGVSRAAVYKGMLGLSGVAIFAAFVALPHVGDPVAAVAVLAVTVFFVYWGSLYWSLPPLLAPRQRVGVLGATMNFAGSSSGIAVPIITGFILQWTGAYAAVLGFFAACALLYAVATLLIAFPQQPAD